MKLRTVPTSLLQLLAHASAQGAAVNLSDLTVTFPSSDALCAAWSDAQESHVTGWGFTLLRPASPSGAEAARRAELSATGAARWLQMVTVSCGPLRVEAESAEAAAVAMARAMLQGLPPAHGDDVERAALNGEVWAARALEARGPFAWTWVT